MAGGKTKKQANEPESISFGYVVIPTNVDRDSYVEMCLRRGKVSVMKEGGIFNMDLYITREALQNIHFPQKPGEKGTAVVIGNNPYTGTQIIIGTYNTNDDFFNWSEDVFRFRKVVDNTSATLSIDPKNKVVNLTIDSPEEIQINMASTGSEKSQLNLFSTGTVSIKANKKVSVLGYEEIETKIINVEKPDDEIRSVVMNLEKVQVVRKTETIDQTLTIDDEGTSIQIKEDVSMKLTEKSINLKTGESTLMMDNSVIEFNGGGLNGLIKIVDLTTKLNEFVSTFNSHTHNVPPATFLIAATAGVPNPTPVPILAPNSPAVQFNKDSYENKKITQG